MGGKLVHSIYLFTNLVGLAHAVYDIIVKLGIGKSKIILIGLSRKTVGGRLTRKFLIKTELLCNRCAESHDLATGQSRYRI